MPDILHPSVGLPVVFRAEKDVVRHFGGSLVIVGDDGVNLEFGSAFVAVADCALFIVSESDSDCPFVGRWEIVCCGHGRSYRCPPENRGMLLDAGSSGLLARFVYGHIIGISGE